MANLKTKEGRDYNRNYVSATYYKYKVFLFDLLGRKCSNQNCLVPNGCTDIRCLQFDHIYNDGEKDRIKFKAQMTMLRFYYNNPNLAKERLQILCANCNWIKKAMNRKV